LSAAADIALVSSAAAFAARRHVGQTRKGVAREPFLNHLAEVAWLLAATAEASDPELVAAGWLHDTIEDTKTSAEELADTFSERVASIVLECTDDKSLPKAERKRLQVIETPHKSEAAKRVKIADKTSNLRDIASSPPDGWPIERCFAYVDWAVEVAASCRGLAAGLDEAFDQAVTDARRAISARSQTPAGA
jgi:(p)ppGpp synthase/HD superfamily hydrolase